MGSGRPSANGRTTLVHTGSTITGDTITISGVTLTVSIIITSTVTLNSIITDTNP